MKKDNDINFQADADAVSKKINSKALFTASSMAGALLVLFVFFMNMFSNIIIGAAKFFSGDSKIVTTLIAKFGYDKVNWIFIDIVQLLAISAAVFIVFRINNFGVKSIIRNKPVNFENALFIIPVGLGFGFSANFIINIIIGFFKEKGVTIPDGEITVGDNKISTVLIMAFAICVFAPVVEEFIFRGCILNILKPFGSRHAIIFSALAFSLLHGNLGQGFGTFVMGIFFGIAAVKTNSIYMSVLMHMINNIIAFGVTILKGFDEESLWIGLIGLLIIVILALSIILFFLRFRRLRVESFGEIQAGRLKKVSLLYANPLILAYIGMQLFEIIRGIVK
ncbi:MAG: type II CAAX endopeptidase family protein [Oscillospiraceae bacterium]|jgi:hypothetical protein